MSRPFTSRLRPAPHRSWLLLAAAIVVPALQAAAMTPAQAHFAPAPPPDPPPVTVLTQRAGNGNGDIFIAPFGDSGTYANGPEIINTAGQVLWFHPVPAGEEAVDFRPQRYDGRPVLTWWQGTGLGGLSSGTDYIYNDRYQQIATVSAGNGYQADGHEFLITPWNTALILAYTTATADLTAGRRPRCSRPR